MCSLFHCLQFVSSSAVVFGGGFAKGIAGGFWESMRGWFIRKREERETNSINGEEEVLIEEGLFRGKTGFSFNFCHMRSTCEGLC